MPANEFRFKKFSIIQEKSAMKVGTDGVLLGAWAEAKNPKLILDIGTGTGLIALMLAQRFPDAKITAVESDNDSAEETAFNFNQSPYFERIKVINLPIQEFKTADKFDLIVSNPPFFELTHQTGSARNDARQHSRLNFDELLTVANSLLATNGKCAFIIPYQSEKQFVEKAESLNLYLQKETRTRGNKDSELKRSLLLFGREKTEIIEDELIIEIQRNQYTEEYKNLTREFYLNF